MTKNILTNKRKRQNNDFYLRIRQDHISQNWKLSDDALYTPNQNQITSHTPTIIYANIKFEGGGGGEMTRRKTKVNIS